MSNVDILGRFVWHELSTTDTAAASAFYSRVVPWRTQPSHVPGYSIWMAGQTQVGGLMQLPAEAAGAPPQWLMYVGAPDTDTLCAKARGLGARICKAPTDIPNVGRFAVLADPQGATFAVFTPGGGPPPGAPPREGGVSWHELATTDLQAALRFYGELFGWTRGPSHDMGALGVYQIFQHGGEPVGGMYNVQGASMPPAWLNYVQVQDCARAVAAAKAAGGRLLHGPVEVPGGSWIGMLLDPQGAAFAVQEMPKPAKAAPPPAAKPVAAPATKPAAAQPPPASRPVTPPSSAAAKPAAVAAAAPAVASRPAAVKAAPAKAAAARRAKPAAKKASKPAARKASKARRAGAKKKVARKPVRKVARKTARKAVRKTARKSARKSAARRTAARRSRRAPARKR